MKTPNNLSSSMEDYLEAILLLKNSKGVVRVRDIAHALEVQRSSVTAALNSLSNSGYVEHERYGYVDLTSKGIKVARDIHTRHELLVQFLHGILGIKKEDARRDACELEHAMSPQTVERLSAFVRFIEHYSENKTHDIVYDFEQYRQKNKGKRI